MFQTNRYALVLSLSIGVVLLACRAGAQAPLVVNGVTDRGIYTDSVTLSVPSTSGHTYSILLDGSAVPPDIAIPVNRMDYHEVLVSRTNVASGVVSNRLVRFIVRSSNRGSPETGLIEWLPYPMIDSTAGELAGAQLNVVTPEDYPLGLEVPVAAWIEDAQGKAVRANATVAASGHPSIRIRRGVGSGYLAPAATAGSVNYVPAIPGISANKTINIEATTIWTSVSGALNGAVSWPDNSRIAVTGSITIPAGSSLTVGRGTIVRLNGGVDVIVRGRLAINGTSDNPVVFTPISRAQPWGGLITTNDSPARIDATGAFFVGTGAKANWFSGTGYDTHLSGQAAFVLDDAVGNFTNCFFIDGRGQVGHGDSSELTMVHCLAQRFLTGGEYVGGTIIVDKSAFIEFPADDGIVNATIANADNDAIYFTTGTHILTDSLFGWCKDDAIDSGSGGAGTVVVSNCWVESALHEALAWSGDGRQTWTYNTVLINNGQGIECGWSGGANSPLVYAGNLLSLGNSVGARYGDNYEGTSGLGLKDGFLTVTNSYILNNYRDVWGQVWDNTWNYRVNDMDIRVNRITTANTFHPNNALWNPASDGWRLASFMSTLPNAAVGIGLAVWTNQFAMSAIFQGVPVRLSSFTTNAVTVNYTFASGGTTLATGTLTFAPGETVKRVHPSGFNANDYTQVRVELSNPAGGELTGQTNVVFLGAGGGAVPLVRFAVASTQGDVGRVAEGVAVSLSAPAAQTVSVNYEFDSGAGTLASGVVTFAPGQTLGWATAAGVDPYAHELIRLRLSNPTGAQIGNPGTVYFIRTVASAVPTNTTLVAAGAVWRYRDAASAAPVGWQNLGFNDSAWLSGPAQLGFSGGEEGDERTVIADNNQITSYFRHSFQVTDPTVYANLSLWLLRDDAGVVYLNGTEIFRSPNLPAPPAQISYTNLTLGATVDNFPETAVTNRNALRAGANVVAVEIHQQAANSSDVSFDFELIGLGAQPPPPPQPVYFAQIGGQYVFAWSDPSFRLEQTDQFEGVNTIWTTVGGTSPVFLPPNPAIPQRFFRLKRP